jgi:hypothetical protein
MLGGLRWQQFRFSAKLPFASRESPAMISHFYYDYYQIDRTQKLAIIRASHVEFLDMFKITSIVDFKERHLRIGYNLKAHLALLC